MIRESAKIDASKFRWENTIGTAMASDLGFRAGEVPVHQIYDNGMEIGWVVRGRKENKLFIYKKRMGAFEETYGWIFESTDGTYSLVIYND